MMRGLLFLLILLCLISVTASAAEYRWSLKQDQDDSADTYEAYYDADNDGSHDDNAAENAVFSEWWFCNGDASAYLWVNVTGVAAVAGGTRARTTPIAPNECIRFDMEEPISEFSMDCDTGQTCDNALVRVK